MYDLWAHSSKKKKKKNGTLFQENITYLLINKITSGRGQNVPFTLHDVIQEFNEIRKTSPDNNKIYFMDKYKY